MIAVDTNILVYAHHQDSQFHDAAFSKLRALAESRSTGRFHGPAFTTSTGSSHTPASTTPLRPPGQALAQIEGWLDSRTSTLVAQNSSDWDELQHMVEASGVTGARIHDARVAAICASSGVRELRTADRDFSRFPVHTVDPLL